MSGERVYTVEGSVATPADEISLADAGLKERDDLQEWVIAHPEILGPDVLILTFEFDRWQASSGSRQLDRFDVLGLDPDGRLVIAELKRDKAPDTVEMQAIKYAALVSRFTPDDLVEIHAAFMARNGGAPDLDIALQRIQDHAGELDPEMLQEPRIVLVAGSFPPIVTSTVHWLKRMGIDVTLQTVNAYRVFDGKTVVTVSQLYPLPELEDLLVSPRRAQEAERRTTTRKREGSTVVRLVASEEIPDGTELTLQPTTEVGAETREAILEWIGEDPARGRATWRNDRATPLVWEATGEAARPTAIVRQMLEAVGSERSVRGPSWWVLPDGRTLTEAAGVAGSASGTFDWTPLHEVMGSLPRGRWTTYGDLADLVGTAAQPIGNHIRQCDVCPNAPRVLGQGGRPRPGFAWSDPSDTRTQQEVLEGEGVQFANGAADPESRLSSAELASLLPGAEA
ncbi:MAG: MGMT family protein [Acidimicrobiales bacterium]|nr:MGMT family protein [Acidimicrobiales bacterium]